MLFRRRPTWASGYPSPFHPGGPGFGYRRPLRRRITAGAVLGGYRAGRAAIRHGIRRRRPLAPTYATLWLLIAGLVARWAPFGAWVIGPLWAWCAAVLAVWQVRRQQRAKRGGPRALHRWEIGYGWALHATAGVWLLLAGTFGFPPPVRGLLLVWLVAAGMPWWWRYRIRPAAAADEDPAPVVDERLATWNADVYAPDGLAPGVTLGELSPDNGGNWDAVFTTRRGKHTVNSLMAIQHNIGAVFGASAGQFIVEPLPGGELHKGRVLMARDNPTHKPAVYDQSWMTCVDGCVPFTVYPDGQRGWERIWLPGSGTVNTLMSGDTGAGKSAGLTVGIIQSVATGVVIPWVGDPKGGASFPAWSGEQGLASWRATELPEMRRQARAIRRLVHDRYVRMSRLRWTDQWGDEQVGIGFYDPAAVPWPIYEITWDEAQSPFTDPEIAEVMDEILTLVRACGIRFRMALPYPTAEELGGSAKAKQALNAGNTVAYRNNLKYTKGFTLPEWMPHPAEIPLQIGGGHSKGTCVLYSSAPDSQRPTFSRAVYPDRDRYWSRIAAARIPDEDPDDLAALGDVYATWRQRRERGEDGLDEVKPTVIDLGAGKPTGTPQPAPAVEPARRRYAGTVGEQIVAFLADHGPATSGTIAEGIDRPLGSVSRKCSELLEAGQLAGGKYSAYRLPEPDLVEAAA